MKITESEFKLYETVRRSGVVNMMFASKVAEITNMTKEQVFYIMKTYDALEKKYGEKNGNNQK